jgi:hypothetical protein
MNSNLPKLKSLWVAALAMSLQGCLVLTADVARHRPDPMASQFVRVAGVSGKTVTLADGRTLELAGLDLGGLSAEQRQTLEQYLRNLPNGEDGLLVYQTTDGRARLECVGGYWPRIGWESLAVPIFPHYVDQYPGHRDVGQMLLSDGLAKAAPQELGNLKAPSGLVGTAPAPSSPKLATLYEEAEQHARTERRGIWRGPQEELVMAAQLGHVAKLSKWLAMGADVNAPAAGWPYGKQTALSAAAESGRLDAARWLLDHGAGVDGHSPGQVTPIHLAIKTGHLDVVALLLRHGAEFDAAREREALLNQAAGWQPAGPAVEVINWLVDHGVPADGNNVAAGTPLMLAAFGGPPEVIECLIARGADVNARAGDGTRPIDMARRNNLNGNVNVELLRSHGARE